jgi:hypothetical protein
MQCGHLGLVPGRSLSRKEAEKFVEGKIRQREGENLGVVWADFRVLKWWESRGHEEYGLGFLLKTILKVYEANPV